MLIYVEGLSYENFREYAQDIKRSIEEIIRIEELDLTALSRHLNISRQTLYGHFRNNKKISFRSLNKMNNFLKEYKKKLDEVVKENPGFISVDEDTGAVH